MSQLGLLDTVPATEPETEEDGVVSNAIYELLDDAKVPDVTKDVVIIWVLAYIARVRAEGYAMGQRDALVLWTTESRQ